MNRQVNPDLCYETEDGVLYMLVPAHSTPEWYVRKNGVEHRTFTSLMAAKGWLEHVLEHPQADSGRVIAASLHPAIKSIKWETDK
jgi:hypothetical protein